MSASHMSGTSSTARSIAPLAAMAATWGARRIITKSYEKQTGKHAPLASSPDNSIISKVIWAAALAAAIALAESLVWKVLDRPSAQDDLDGPISQIDGTIGTH